MIKKSIYPELNNKDWLYEKYFIKNLSTLQIAKLIGAKQPNSVRQALIKFGLKPRNFREGQIIGKKDTIIDNRDFIDGSLLGDAGLSISNKKSKVSCPYLSKKNKYKDHLEWFGKAVAENFSLKKVTVFQKFPNSKYNKKCTYYTLRTFSSEKLKSYFERWYPSTNGYKKIVPKDLVMTPTVLLNWFLDDGHSCWRNRDNEYKKLNIKNKTNWSNKKKQVIVGFCSQSFSKEDNEWLVKEIKKLGIGCYTGFAQNGSKVSIFINQSDTNKFFDLIVPCPIQSLNYKWKII